VGYGKALVFLQSLLLRLRVRCGGWEMKWRVWSWALDERWESWDGWMMGFCMFSDERVILMVVRW
jgi:hypothetical protein